MLVCGFGLGLVAVYGLMGTWVLMVRLDAIMVSFLMGLCPGPWARLIISLLVDLVLPSIETSSPSKIAFGHKSLKEDRA